MRAKRPFPLERPRKHKSLGVHAPDPLRDDPNHPHASLGPDRLKAAFADGGMIGAPEQQGIINSSEATGGFAEGGKVKQNYAKPFGQQEKGYQPGKNRDHTKGGEADDFYRGRSRPKPGEQHRRDLPMIDSHSGGKPDDRLWRAMSDHASATKDFKKKATKRATTQHDALAGRKGSEHKRESKRDKAAHVERIENDSKRMKKNPNQK